ncbi:hypothetical protein EVJ33_05290 [Exiguobacterium sp. SL-10]|uniref:hypothetical protein n=1 Tax=unclassified Exiguobacterium TaxID=2644629 RepID=UPI00103D1AD7|nr:MULTISPECIES: hypothetical protein [unclassified Exiguobacterium]TCI22878.1 hypothetical protein EVJ34_00215 [Exiguobacterium sp. SL-9]TCI30712.1 hypothetical protein EVJ33_05290 [Exiguobacterium sp. SL-10]
MRVTHTLKSTEREKLEIIAGLLRQAGYRGGKIDWQTGINIVRLSRDDVSSEPDERARIRGIVDHFEIEDWTVTFS